MKKVRFFALILVLVLGALGAGYAAWHDVLEVDATVTTGDIDVQFMDAVWCIDQTKDIAKCTLEISDDGKTLTVTIEEYYPCANGVVAFWVENKGSVPVKLRRIMTIAEDPLEVTRVSDFCETGWDYQKLFRGVQLGSSAYCESTKAMHALHFYIPQYVCDTHSTENLELEFKVELDFVQYNKFED